MSSKAPLIIVINLGGNDLSSMELGEFKAHIFSDFKYIRSVFPTALLAWFDILPRLHWREVDDASAKPMDLKRKRANRLGRQAWSDSWLDQLIAERLVSTLLTVSTCPKLVVGCTLSHCRQL
ncbi:hypothetical protein MAR_009869 [Mya arenaria]|uniref:SGNH hydrolase-type esterase domain-containing protein n=1 Tax=Mya arenaria TaxID=6604 RepID=A0ABY7E840_MYAAR|nr:hypothetical protein MAR_009869 [Mya arenaria]